MASSTDIWSILIIISLAHSLFVANLLVIKKAYRKTEGKWLLVLLFGLFWLQCEFLSVRWPFEIGFPLFYGTRHGTWLLIGPTFYFYLKALVGSDIRKKELIYLLPFFLFTLVLPALLSDFLSFRQVHYGMLSPFDNRPDSINFWQYVYSGVFVGQFFYLLFFILESRHLINQYRKGLKQYFSQLDEKRMRWLAILWVGMLVILFMSSIFLALLFFTEIYRRHMDYLYVVPTSFLIYAMSYRLFGETLQKPENDSKYQKSGLSKNEAEKLKIRLEKEIKDEKVFLKKGLKLSDLSVRLGITNHQLSEVLNQHVRISFYDLVNSYRVEEAKELIKKNPQYTLLQIAFDAGFNNKTSFVNAFKRFEGITPSQYYKANN